MSVQPEEKTNQPPMKRWHKWLSWLVTFILVGILFSLLYWQPILAHEIADHNGGTQALAPDAFEVLLGETSANLPYFEFLLDDPSVMRIPVAYTIAPTRPRSHPVDYEVLSGDAVFSIAQKFNISP